MGRLQKELKKIMETPPSGIELDTAFMEQNEQLNVWRIRLYGASGTIYEGEVFQLQFKFSDRYPIDSPEVIFVGDSIPIHPHIYSNGHICLSILADDWSPSYSVGSVCISILSMLSSCHEKKRPEGDKSYCKNCAASPKDTHWVFHDDDV